MVLLFDERHELPGLSALATEFVRELTSRSTDEIEVYVEGLDISRFGVASYQPLLRDFLQKKYSGKSIDVVVAVFESALDFLLTSGHSIFPGASIVFCGVDTSYLGSRELPSHVHGVTFKRQFAPTLEIALQLHPMTAKVVVVGGTSQFDERLLEAARRELRPYENRLSFSYLTTLPLEETLKRVSDLPQQTIILYTTIFQDGAGAPFVPHDVVRRISTAARVPVYGFIDQYVGRGIVGGSLYSLAEQGTEAAKLAQQVLAGKALSSPLMVEAHSSKLIFDWSELQRWGVRQSNLPPGSEIRFREPSAWDRYQRQIVVIAAVMLLQLALIIGLLYQRRRRRSAEVEAQQRMAELAHMNRQATVGQLSASIAHELNQPLGAILNNVTVASLIVEAPSPNLQELKAILDDIKRDDQRASEVIKRLRRLLTQGTVDAQEVDVNEVVREVFDILSALAAARDVNLGSKLTQQRLRVKGDRVQLEQVILNLVVNGIEAIAGASNGIREIDCRSWASDGQALISIRDSGPGLPAGRLERLFEPFFTTKGGGMGMGLCIARTIVEAHGGKISAETRPSGAVFHISLPLAKTGGA